MHKLNIVYYEGSFNRSVAVERAKQKGIEGGRPWGFSTEATYPIVPRPNDRIFFFLPEIYAKYFHPNKIEEDGRVRMDGEVKFVELEDGVDELYVHVTDSGYKAFGHPKK